MYFALRQRIPEDHAHRQERVANRGRPRTVYWTSPWALPAWSSRPGPGARPQRPKPRNRRLPSSDRSRGGCCRSPRLAARRRRPSPLARCPRWGSMGQSPPERQARWAEQPPRRVTPSDALDALTPGFGVVGLTGALGCLGRQPEACPPKRQQSLHVWGRGGRVRQYQPCGAWRLSLSPPR